MSNHSLRAISALLPALLLAACTQNPVTQGAGDGAPAPAPAAAKPAAKTETPPAAKPADAAAATGRGAEAKEGDAGTAAPKLGSIGAPEQRSVYFDFDRYDIRDEFKQLVVDHGKFLGERKDARMLIQGNADERGSREYNLALGQRRADAVKKALLSQGVKEESLEAVSLGEEKPKATGHDEAAWAENRRADMLYKGEY